MVRATVNTDASWCPNTKAGGWAVWIAIDGGQRIKKSGTFHRKAKTSTEAELWAMLNGAWIAAQHGARTLLMQGDCVAALTALEQGVDDAVRLLHASMPAPVTLTTKHVKAHTHTNSARHWVNDWCDREAKKHMRKERKQTPKR